MNILFSTYLVISFLCLQVVLGYGEENQKPFNESRCSWSKYSNQRKICLSPGDGYLFRLNNGIQKRIVLLDVKINKDSVLGKIRSAVLTISIDGQSFVLKCTPYSMPAIIDGLRIRGDCVLDENGIWLSVWDALDPIVNTKNFTFPLPRYEILSMGTQAFTEPYHLGEYDAFAGGTEDYHPGIDFAARRGLQAVVSAISGEVSLKDADIGRLAVTDENGFSVFYDHLNDIRADLNVGSKVKLAEHVGYVGKNGVSGGFAHLHVQGDDGLSGITIDLFPWLAAAQTKGNEFAIARPHKVVRVGEEVLLEGHIGNASKGSNKSWWVLHDRSKVSGAKARVAYASPGLYSEQFWIKTKQGYDVDFCSVKVFPAEKSGRFLSRIGLNCFPAGQVKVGEQVSFWVFGQGKADFDDVKLDFGDGTVVENCATQQAVCYTFGHAGLKIIKVSAVCNGYSVAQEVKLRILDS